MRRNHWPDAKCARAFWDQRRLPPYQELLRDTVAWLAPQAGEHWLDLGCGGGELTAALWRASGGRLAEIVALDCAAVNEERIARLRDALTPRIRFVTGDFSVGLPQFADHTFAGIVSGLAISYAETWDESTGSYSDRAYNHLLAELLRVLRPGGRLVFSVNVPNPAFWWVGIKSLGHGFRSSKPLQYLANGLRMVRYGRWLKREARRGRFHYLPQHQLLARLQAIGFTGLECKLSYSRQAYVVRAAKQVTAPAATRPGER